MNSKKTAFVVLAALFLVAVTITIGTVVSKTRAQDDRDHPYALAQVDPNTHQTPKNNTITVPPVTDILQPFAQPVHLAPTPKLQPLPNETKLPIPEDPYRPQKLSKPLILAVSAQDQANAVLVHLNKTVHIRGQVTLETSLGSTGPPTDTISLWLKNRRYKAIVLPTASRTLTFPATPGLQGAVLINSLTMAPGAAVRDQDGNDLDINIGTPIPWTPGPNKPRIPADWSTATYVSPAFASTNAEANQSPEITAVTHQTAAYNDLNSPATWPLWKIDLNIPFHLNTANDTTTIKPAARTSHALYYSILPTQIQVQTDDDTSGQALWQTLSIELPEQQRFPEPIYPTKADCLWNINHSNSIDQIMLRTITNTDPATLTDSERYDWHQFFDRTGHKTQCNSFWSEPITPANAEKRNDPYSHCITEMEQEKPSDIHQIYERQEILEMARRPYISLNLLERHVLRDQLPGKSCRNYYPQLYSGRWIPMPDDK